MSHKVYELRHLFIHFLSSWRFMFALFMCVVTRKNNITYMPINMRNKVRRQEIERYTPCLCKHEIGVESEMKGPSGKG